MFVCAAFEPYQGGERRQVHADSDHAAGEPQLAETRFPCREEHAKVEPTARQDQARRCRLGHHQVLQHTAHRQADSATGVDAVQCDKSRLHSGRPYAWCT